MSLYKRRIAEGQCGSCGKEDIKPGESLGPRCKEKSKAQAAKQRTKRRASGLCLESGCKSPAETGKTRCIVHAEKQKQDRKQTYSKRKAAGLCVQSGCTNAPKAGCVLCQRHIDEFSETTSRHYREQRDAGLCGYIGCTRKPVNADGGFCEEHLEKQRQYRAALKLEALTAYGGSHPKCEWPDGCDVDDPALLQLDHVDGGGRKHRLEIDKLGGYEFYLYLKSEGFPQDIKLRVLCPTHNIRAYNELRKNK